VTSPPDPFHPLLVQASEELQAGRQQVAEGIYRDILERSPGHPVATHFLGICLVQTGRVQEDPSVPAAYRQRFPQDAAATSLDNWGRLEDEHPEIFAGMYQFWVAKPV
jgi:hypothetical protein